MGLTSDYASQESERRLFVRGYDRDISAFIAKWYRSGKTERNYYDQAVRLLNAALNSSPSKNWLAETPSSLASKITNQGSKDTINLDMRDACLHFAQLGWLTNNTSAVEKASALLNKFIQMIPSWPIWNPFNETNYANRTANNQDLATSYQSETSSGIWGNWIYFDTVLSTPLVEAWVLIRDHPDNTVNNTGMFVLIERFKNVLKYRYSAAAANGQPDYSNQDQFSIRGIIDFGLLIPDPEYLHEGVRHLKNWMNGMFYSDGWWNEASTAYHGDCHAGVDWLIEDFPSSYTDKEFFKNSVDGKRFDGMSLSSLMASYLSRLNEVSSYRYPNNFNIAIGDSIYDLAINTDQRRSNPKLPPRQTPTPSKLFGAMGQGTICLGGTGNETMVTLHYGPYNTHGHFDALNLNIWSKGQEVISETHYRNLGASTRAWSTSTPGHVTVTVNKKNQTQTGVYFDNRRKPTGLTSSPLDAIPGMPNWQWRWNASSGTDHGKLRLFNTEFDSVKVIEADAEKSYTAVVSDITKYRRTISLVKIDDNDCYIADIFRIKGGTSYDYNLHSCLHQPHIVTVTATSPLTITSGKLYPDGTSSDGLDKLDMIRTVTTNDAWSAEFIPTLASENWKLYTYMVGATATNLIQATGPAMRIENTAPFVCARRDATESVYIAVHHPISKTETSKIQSVASLTGTSTDVLAFKVVLTNGRTDTIMSGESLTSNSYVDGRINFVGSFGHLSETTSPTADNQWLYLVDGSTLRVGTKSITGSVSLTGSVAAITRVLSGDSVNSFVTVTPLPTGSNLNSYTLLVDPTPAGATALQRWGYKIDSVSMTGATCSIITLDEPGLSFGVDATGQYMKQLQFPSWGSYGTPNFKIPSSARLVRGATGVWNFIKAGSATGTT